jgi:tetratricopeptide (TPR) repeat protein/predicted Ser/Thr protein kinase
MAQRTADSPKELPGTGKDPAAADTLRPGPDTTPLPTPLATAKLPQSERYEVQELLGTGGMGKVYKAFDRKLKRAVALKFLRGADAALEARFLREAQAQARVDHAHVCKVYEVGRIGDDPYIAMQFIDGKTLREVAKDLTLPQKLLVLRDIAAAVHAANQLGLVHRDLKPANILIERAPDGSLRSFVTDFGLARDLEKPGDTVQGALLGTPQYMAPEQAKGDHKNIDARTDVYGLGATLYEALTGKPPFDGGSHLQTLYKMLHEEPLQPRKHAPLLPADVEGIVLKCLEKAPGMRYPSARALAEDLQRSIDGEPVLARPPGALGRAWRKLRRNPVPAAAIAVLVLGLLLPRAWTLWTRGVPLVVAVADFDNQTGDEGLDGLSGMLITSLEQSPRLSVLTRSRMFDLLRQQGSKEPARIDEPVGREVAKQAGAQALLLTTIRKFDDLFVIDLKVLDPRTNVYVAALKEQAAGKASLPALIDRLSESARRSLRDEGPGKRPPVEAVTTRDLTAYQHFFRGEEAIDRLKFSQAVEQFRAALAIDKQFALAWYRMAYALMWMHDGVRGREAIGRAMQFADRLPEKERLQARGVWGSIFGKGQEAYDAFKECADRFPSEKECQFGLGDIIFHAGYASYSVPKFRAALQLDPVMERGWQHLIWAYQLLGDGPAMLQAARDYAQNVGSDDAWDHLGRTQAAQGLTGEARATFGKAAQLHPRSALPIADLAALSAWQFKVDAAAAELAPALDPQRSPRDRWLAHYTLAGALTQGGRIREAIRAYEAAGSDAREAADPELEAIALAADGLARFLFQRDAAAARRIAHDAVARGAPETMFAFLYPLLGDIADYARVLKIVGDPLADKSVAVMKARAAGDYAAAAAGIEDLSDKSPYRDFLYYVLADSWMQAGRNQKALETLLRAQATFPGVISPGPGYGGLFRARSDYQLGVLYERMGQNKPALEATRRFLEAWSHADADLPELKDARARLLRLQASGDIPLR